MEIVGMNEEAIFCKKNEYLINNLNFKYLHMLPNPDLEAKKIIMNLLCDTTFEGGV